MSELVLGPMLMPVGDQQMSMQMLRGANAEQELMPKQVLTPMPGKSYANGK